MTPLSVETNKNFVVSPKSSGVSQPLEVHHLSHDLRGPLNSILGFCELLLEGIEGPLTENQEADIAAIYQSAQNLLRLISSVVDLSKLEAGRLSFDSIEVDLGSILEKIMSFDFSTTKPEQVELIVSLPETLPPVQGDAGRIEQMVMNLVRFAFKVQRTGAVMLTANHNDQAVTVQVSIPQLVLTPEKVAELFDLAVHVDAAGRSELGIGGLELPLTRGLVKAHHGQVRAESEAGIGTTLYLTLPLS